MLGRALLLPATLLLGAFLMSEAFLPPTPATKSMARFAKAKQETDDEEEKAVMEELQRKIRGLYNADGTPYAPWMLKQIDLEAAARAIRNRRRKEAAISEETIVPDSALGALKYRIVGENDVELGFLTGEEKDNVGFTILRRLRESEDNFEEIASYKTWAPLNSKGPQGGLYTYIDPDVEPGAYVYRVLDTDRKGKRQVLAQSMVEVTSRSEDVQTKILYGVFALLIAGLGIGLSSLDPLQ